MLDRVLGPGEYDISFLETSEGAYGRIVASQPSRVIFCMHVDDAESLHVLSMLNLDPRTNRIPILTCIAAVSGVHDDLSGGAGPSRPSYCGVLMN